MSERMCGFKSRLAHRTAPAPTDGEPGLAPGAHVFYGSVFYGSKSSRTVT